MTWFYVDDGLHSHRKVWAAGTPAMGLWVRAGSWCADELTDGFVPTEIVKAYGTAPMARSLVSAGLWAPEGGGYRFHQWNEPGRQPTRTEVEERRRKRAEAGAQGGKRSGEVRRGRSKPEALASPTAEASASPNAAAKTNPVPSPLPNPSLVTLVCRRLSGDARKATTTDEERAELWAMWAEVAGPGVDLEADLRSWLMRNAETDLHDPAGALIGWLRKGAERARGAAPVGCQACAGGWLPDDVATGRPVPCPTCRPHLRAVAS